MRGSVGREGEGGCRREKERGREISGGNKYLFH